MIFFSPGDAISTVGSYLWVIPVLLWGFVLLGVTGTIINFLQWVNRGTKKIFSPIGLFVFITLTIVSFIIASVVSGWFKSMGWI